MDANQPDLAWVLERAQRIGWNGVAAAATITWQRRERRSGIRFESSNAYGDGYTPPILGLRRLTRTLRQFHSGQSRTCDTKVQLQDPNTLGLIAEGATGKGKSG